MSLTRRSLLAGGAALSSAALLTGRISATGIELDGSPTPWASPVGGEMVVYSGRNEALVGPLLEEMKSDIGVDISVRYGNTAEGFAAENAGIDAAAERAGRDPATLERSACVFVSLEGAGVRNNDERISAVPAETLESHLRALAEAGGDEAILVVDPITETSIRSLGTVIPTA